MKEEANRLEEWAGSLDIRYMPGTVDDDKRCIECARDVLG